MNPFYQDDQVTIYHGDCRELLPHVEADVLVTDPPYGIDYNSGARRNELAASIQGDKDTSLRDGILDAWDGPALVFGTWRIPRPEGTKARLIWDTKGALGMGDLSIPWKPSDQEIYVLGSGFSGHRGSNVLTVAPVQAKAANGRLHPHEKPVALLAALMEKCPPGVIVDPFMGSGSTLVAGKSLSRKVVGIEVEERYCEVAARRCSQEAFDLGAVA
jgi:site-specific DNA-methyltransferase (adenine-specific)